MKFFVIEGTFNKNRNYFGIVSDEEGLHFGFFVYMSNLICSKN